MTVKALKSFAGKICMNFGETRQVDDGDAAYNSLIAAGLLQRVDGKAEPAQENAAPAAGKRKSGKKSAGK